jgi:hypothetical protein
MATIGKEVLQQQATEFAAIIDEGFAPASDIVSIQNGQRGASAEAARRWRMTVRGVHYRLESIRRNGFEHIISAAIERYNERKAAEPLREAVRVEMDALEEHRLTREVNRLRAQNKDLLERLANAGDLAASLEGVAEPLEPVSFQRVSKERHQPETALLVLSDLQWGETIDLAVMDGLNSYNPDIARARLARVFAAWADLLTVHWAGPSPERIILALAGDLVSGEIHEELAKTNGLLSIPALRDAAAHICAGIRLLHDALPDAKIDIISVPGNHGRTTRKPESKLYAAHSYDTLCADIVELEFRECGKLPAWLTMWKPSSGDALIWVYGYRVLITHGDRIGSRGGAGFVGTAATVARGFKKLVMDYAGRGITLDFIICGHFHTALQLEEGICNGALPGPSEYSRDLRFRPRPAVQAFITMHPRRGVTQIRWADAGDPAEGDLYAPKAPPVDTKPRFRIPAIGEGAAWLTGS